MIVGKKINNILAVMKRNIVTSNCQFACI